MENENTYKSISELTSELSALAQKIDAGQLTYEELEDVCTHASQLYERLIILKYKAAERLIKGDDIETLKSRFKINLKRTNQLSLEEVISDTVKEKLENAQTSLLPEIEKEDVHVEAPKEPIKIEKKAAANKNSLNENFLGKRKTLGDKLNKTPIKDLKTAIGVNMKFLFINDLFKGENVPYNEALEKLNSFNNFEDAKNLLEPIKNKMSWDEEHPSVVAFLDLVERRYL